MFKRGGRFAPAPAGRARASRARAACGAGAPTARRAHAPTRHTDRNNHGPHVNTLRTPLARGETPGTHHGRRRPHRGAPAHQLLNSGRRGDAGRARAARLRTQADKPRPAVIGLQPGQQVSEDDRFGDCGEGNVRADAHRVGAHVRRLALAPCACGVPPFAARRTAARTRRHTARHHEPTTHRPATSTPRPGKPRPGKPRHREPGRSQPAPSTPREATATPRQP